LFSFCENDIYALTMSKLLIEDKLIVLLIFKIIEDNKISN